MGQNLWDKIYGSKFMGQNLWDKSYIKLKSPGNSSICVE